MGRQIVTFDLDKTGTYRRIRTLVQLVVPKYVPACPDRKEAVTAIQVRRKGLAVKRMERVRCFTSYQSVTVTTLASQGPRPYEPRRKWSSFFPLSVRKLGTTEPVHGELGEGVEAHARMPSRSQKSSFQLCRTEDVLAATGQTNESSPAPASPYVSRRKRGPFITAAIQSLGSNSSGGLDEDAGECKDGAAATPSRMTPFRDLISPSLRCELECADAPCSPGSPSKSCPTPSLGIRRASSSQNFGLSSTPSSPTAEATAKGVLGGTKPSPCSPMLEALQVGRLRCV